MKVRNGMVLMDPGAVIKESKGGISIPEVMHMPHKIARVVAAGCEEGDPDPELVNGDYVSYYMDNPYEIDGNHKMTLRIGRKIYLYMHTSMLQGKILRDETEMEKMLNSEKAPEIVIDYETQFKIIGRKVAIDVFPTDKKSENGIIFPEVAIGNKEVMVGKIVSVGPNANDHFATEEISMGDTVMVSPSPSGGKLPYSGSKFIWRTNGSEVIMKLVDNEWVPVGGRLLIRPFLAEYEEVVERMTNDNGKSYDQKFLKSKTNPNIVIPLTAKIFPQQAHVVAVGLGWSPDSPLEKAYGTSGLGIKKGDCIATLKLFGPKGPVNGADFVKVGDEDLVICPEHLVDGIIMEDIDIFHPKKYAEEVVTISEYTGQ